MTMNLKAPALAAATTMCSQDRNANDSSSVRWRLPGPCQITSQSALANCCAVLVCTLAANLGSSTEQRSGLRQLYPPIAVAVAAVPRLSASWQERKLR